jgi:hypothetical protein
MARSSNEPEVEAVQDPNGEENGTGQQKAPKAICKAREDVREPRSKGRQANRDKPKSG